MLSFLFKPKWQHRDDNVRAAAVATLRDVELSKALPRLAREDSSEKVRWAALERLNDKALWLHAALNDQAEGVRTQSRKRVFKELLADPDGSSFQPLLQTISDAESLERVAVEARSLKLRRSALERIDRAGWLADRALSEADADTRAWLASRLEPGPSLERLLEAARTRDKRVYKIAKDKLEAAQRSEGSPALAEKEALALCKRLEALLRDLPADALAQAHASEQAWAAFGVHAPASLSARFFGVLETIRRAVAAIHAPPVAPAAEVAPVVDSAPAVEAQPEPVPDEPDARLTELLQEASSARADEVTLDHLRSRWSQLWASAAQNSSNQKLKASFEQELARLKELFNAQLKVRQEQHDELRRLLDQLGQHLDAGDIKAARAAEVEIAGLLAKRRDLDQGPDGKRLGGLKTRLAKLGDWQKWSNNQARNELCAEVEALPALALHPDAVATKIKELQQRWSRLDQIENLNAEQAKALGIARRFRALCFEALKPAKGFFEKRAEVRQRHTADFETQIAEVETLLNATPIDSIALIQRKRDLSDGFRELDRTDPAKRTEIAKRMKALLDRISQSIDARFAEVRTEKEKLIAQLRFKAKHSPREEVIELIKSTQQRFKQVGRGQRASDQALWDELKAVADPHFAALKLEREQVDEAARAVLVAQQQTIDAVAALAAEAVIHPGSAQQSLDALEQRWSEFEKPARDLDKAFQQAVNQVHRALADVGAAKRHARNQALRHKADQCSRIEGARLRGEAIDEAVEREQWSALGQLEEELEKRLQQRFERALQTSETSAADLEANSTEAQRLALLIEFLDGRASPPAFQAARMEFQVRRLAARLGGTEKPAERERAESLEAFCALGPLPPDVRAEAESRVFG